jgi:membrane dipeptidase
VSVFIGADLDGVENLPAGMEGVQDVGKIYEALLRRNYSERLVRDIFYNNLMNILERAT